MFAQAPPAPTGGMSSSATYLLMGVAAVFIIYVALRPMWVKKKDPLSGQFRISLTQQKALEREMNTLVVELHNMARKMSAQLDTRAAKLEQLIADADQRLALLKQLGQIDGDISPAPRPAVTEKDDAPRMRLVRDEPLETAAKPFETSNLELPDDRPDERHRAIYELADAGLSAPVIAQRLSRPAGEIELILALRPRSAAGE
jgi:hypothetical protein